MNREQLRVLQAPLKQRYRDEAGAALAEVAAEGTFAAPGITWTVRTWAEEVRAGLHTSTGSTARTPAPGTCCSRRCWRASG